MSSTYLDGLFVVFFRFTGIERGDELGGRVFVAEVSRLGGHVLGIGDEGVDGREGSGVCLICACWIFLGASGWV